MTIVNISNTLIFQAQALLLSHKGDVALGTWIYQPLNFKGNPLILLKVDKTAKHILN